MLTSRIMYEKSSEKVGEEKSWEAKNINRMSSYEKAVNLRIEEKSIMRRVWILLKPRLPVSISWESSEAQL